jgi:lysozyme
MQRLKISREGVILIKSFEGFRPHAVRRDDGQWVIGYGHTLSAREGGVVSEADAELLLQFDLIPVAKALNAVSAPLNQHQFDALASFAFSVGLDRFESSDVLSRLASGSTGEAADAIAGWTDPAPSDAPLRRRAAERALFVADPARPVALADLLAAPLPPPPVAAATVPAPEPEAASEPETVESPAAEAAAFTPAEDTASEPGADIVPELAAAPVVFAPVETTPEEPTADATPEATDSIEPELVVDPEIAITPDAQAAELADRVEEEAAALTAPELSSSDVSPEVAPRDEAPAAETTDGLAARLSVHAMHRYAPYAGTIIGPLPGGAVGFKPLDVAPTPSPAPDAPVVALEIDPNLAPASPFPDLAGDEPLHVEALAADDVVSAPAPDETVTPVFATPVYGSPLPEALMAPSAAAPIAATFEPVEAPAVTTFEPAISTEAPSEVEGELLVLSPLDENSVFPAQRLVWPHAETAEEPALFEDDGALRLGAHQMIRHEVVSEEPRRIDWRETGLYILMGAFGLVTFGMSMAAFRRASLPSGGSEFTTIAWVLAVFGFACIAVSAWNLYRKLGRPED